MNQNEIITNCSATKNDCGQQLNEIAVFTIISNPANNVSTYNYTVTGGKIVGVGGKPPHQTDKVFWDLSNVKPGIYQITAAVDNGCGFCGKTVTKTVTVKECADCKTP